MAGTINNIYISGYDNTYTYDKYDMVSGQTGLYPFYFVSAVTGNSGQLDNVGWASNAYWKRFDDRNFLITDVWTPSFNTQVMMEPRSKLAPFGDGYVQRSDAGLFFNKVSYEMTSEHITNKELKSLVGFFEYKGGVDFIKTDIPPFITGGKYIGRNWKHSYVGDNINNFSATLSEFISDRNNV